MAQLRFIKYKDAITSEHLNQRTSGIIAAGVYRGFDAILNPLGLDFKLDHSITGELYTEINLSISPKTGSWVTKQGVVIKETDAISLVLETNLGNGSPRTDLVVGRHYHDKLYPGGVAASYQIIKGQNGTSAEPDISGLSYFGEITVIGKLLIPANASSMAAVVWKRNRPTTLGGETPALIDHVNEFKNQVSLNQAADVQVTESDFEIAQRGIIANLNNGNTFIVNAGAANLDLLPNKPNGTRINLFFKGATTIRGFTFNIVGGIVGSGQKVGFTAGYIPISIRNADAISYVAKVGQILTFEKVDLKGAFNSNTNTYEYGEVWKLVSSSDGPERVQILETGVANAVQAIADLNTALTTLTGIVNNINPPRLVQDIDFVGDMLEHFDATGKAKSSSAYYGRAICNGQNGTPDYRGRFRVSFSDVEVDYSSVGFIGGSKLVTLGPKNIAPHQHYVANGGQVGSAGGLIPSQSIKESRAVGSGSQNYDLQRSGGDNANVGLSSRDIGGASGTEAEPHENRPPYRVALTLMWIGVPA